MSNNFDDDDVFDDDVFDDVDATELDTLQNSQPTVQATGQRRKSAQGRKTNQDQSDDDLFDGVDDDEILQSSQAQPEPQSQIQKRSSGDANVPNKRVKTEHDTSTPVDPAEDQENLTLARRLLKEKFGYQDFRHEQEGAIRRILAGKSSLVIFPTGAGKSLCYQIPGIAFSELDKSRGLRAAGQSGITIVISPLIALMKDQVDALKRRDIAADCIDYTKTWEQLQEINQKLAKGELQIIYCSPERLNNERFVESMKYVPGGVRLVAVDEAHCISEWGHSFRPEYLKVARFVEEIKAERVICLTATATARVADDVIRAFNIDEAGVFRTTPYRPNLKLYAESVDDPSKKFSKIVSFLRKHPGPTLVYITVQREAEDLAAKLRQQRFDAAAFHAGLKVEDKTKTQDDFMANRVQIIVATIAFGMGVDKPDIRNIVHYTIPSTVEEYSQQIGRAGRDGKTSYCMFYLCNADFWIRENFARGDLPSFDPFRRLIKDIFDDEVSALPLGAVFTKNTNEQMKEFDIRSSPLSVTYATLELRFNLIRAITPEYSQYMYEITMPDLYREVMTNMKNSDRPEAKAIMEHAEKKSKYTHVDVHKIVRATGFHRADIIQIMDHLDRDGIIRLTAKGVTPKFRVLQKKLPRTDEELDELAKKMYEDLERKEKDALQRTRELVDIITGEKCFAQGLAQHFGMSLPDDKEKCGHCTWCETGTAVELPPKEQRTLDLDGIRNVLEVCPVRDDPRFLARVAFGIMSPRVRVLKMAQTSAWESLVDQDFDELLREFTAACKAAKLDPKSEPSSSRDRAFNRTLSGGSQSSARGKGYSSRGSSGRGRSRSGYPR